MALLPMSKGSKVLCQRDPVSTTAAGSAVTPGNPAGVAALLALGVASAFTKLCQAAPLLAVGRNGLLGGLGDRYPQQNRWLPLPDMWRRSEQCLPSAYLPSNFCYLQRGFLLTAPLSQLQAASLHCLIGPQERPSCLPLSGLPLLVQRLLGSVCRQRHYHTGMLNRQSTPYRAHLPKKAPSSLLCPVKKA